MVFGADFDRFLLVIGALFVFGIVYAWFTEYSTRRGWLDGYTAFYVVAGVLITQLARLALPYSDLVAENLLIILSCYAASGLPMIAADVARHLRQRESLLQAVRDDGSVWEGFANEDPAKDD